MANNEAEARHVGEVRHVGEIRDQLVAALGAGGFRLALVLRTGEVLTGTLRGNSNGGDFPHYNGSVRLLPDDGREIEVDFLDIRLVDRA